MDDSVPLHESLEEDTSPVRAVILVERFPTRLLLPVTRCVWSRRPRRLRTTWSSGLRAPLPLGRKVSKH